MSCNLQPNLETPKIQLKMDVDPQYYSRIIGRGGVVINKIRKDHNVSINLPERDSSERTITITGYEKDAEAAKKYIMDHFVKQNLETPKIQLKMSVDPQHYARIIVRGGVVIEKIREDHNVSINFPERDSSERTITITGCEKDAEAAKECIMDLFVKQRRSDLFHLINKYQKELEREYFLKAIESTDPDWYREIHDFLIKLTSQKIYKIRNLQVGTEEKLNVLVNLTYESAVYESDRTTLYAAMCQKLALVKVPLAGQPGQYVNIKELLVTKCLKEFEQGICYELEYEDFLKTIELTDAEKSKGLRWKFYKEKDKIRFRRIGNIRFIHGLFKSDMITLTTVHECIIRLLGLGNEISIECACILIKHVRGQLKGTGHSSYVKKYLDQLQKILDKPIGNPRIIYMLKKLLHVDK